MALVDRCILRMRIERVLVPKETPQLKHARNISKKSLKQ